MRMEKWGVYLNKKIIKISCMIILVTVLIFPYLKAKHLTMQYGDEALQILEKEGYYYPSFYRVLDYSEHQMKLYYVIGRGDIGLLFTIHKDNSIWEVAEEELIWTDIGNADDKFMWPYYPHE